MVNVSINGVSLRSLSGHIVMADVTENKVNTQLTAVSRANGIGQRVTQNNRNYTEFVVKFGLSLLRGNEDTRATILNKVNAWAAAGGALSVSYRPDVHMDVICTELVQVGNIKKWQETYSLTFRAYAVPYWVADNATSVTAKSKTSGSVTLTLTGNAKTPLHVYAVNAASSALTSVTLTVGSQVMKFTGMSIAKGKAFDLDYSNGILSIEAAGAHAGKYRSTDSVDDIWLSAGGNTVKFSSNVACNWQIYTYERWL